MNISGKSIAYAVGLLFLAYASFFMTFEFPTYEGRHNVPFFLWVINTIDLFIHEGGHFFFSFFGKIIYAMGGSLMQVLIPVISAIVFARSSPPSLPFTLYWVGHNLVDVSVYMADAPIRQLPLISRSATHDWNYLAHRLGIMDSIVDLASAVHFLAGCVFVASLGIGCWVLYKLVRPPTFRPAEGSRILQ